ncbi:calcium-activated chloride channel-domain-containing protein [Kalaharituber pfeilii]|nr:calcium-activated chloride channel-domain-containing protein [Kalaharituber pfeilii]
MTMGSNTPPSPASSASSLEEIAAPAAPRKPKAKYSNLGADYVISFRFTSADKEKAERQFERLVTALDRVGLRVEARDGRDGSVLLFVRIKSQRRFMAEVYRSRVKDWLHGIRPAAPDKETQKSLDKEPVTDAERLRLVYLLLTLPEGEGGAGITPKQGEWNLVESIFALHDRSFNKEWLKRWSTSWTISPTELDALRDKFGEKVGFYFAFLQNYFAFLIFPAIFGATSYFLLPAYSPLFALANGLWSIIFVEWWRRQEIDLGVRWGVRGCAKIQNKRAAFQPDGVVEDSVTGQRVPVFSAWKRLARQSLQVPFALIAAGILASLFAAVFGIEVFLSEIYNGPGKSVLVFLPTVLLSVFVPTLSAILTNIATRLNDYENYENADSYDYAMTQKIFVLNVITSYVPLFLTAFVYVPFGAQIMPHLNFFNTATVQFIDEKHEAPATFQINPDRLRKQVIYFTVTAQVVGLALELVVPFVKRRVFKKAKQMQSSRKEVDKASAVVDRDEEKSFLERVRDEAELDVYNVSSDLREMVTQFGYLTLFSPIWPLTAVSFIVNNWIELRSDAAKICLEMQRPVPLRTDSIGPWLDNLSFLSWLGSITSAALIYLFSESSGIIGNPKSPTLWGVLTAILFSEHLYFAARMVIRIALNKIESPGLVRERKERYLVRKRYLEESLGEIVTDETERMFWLQQSSVQATAEVGKEIIGRAVMKKNQ